jgi:hypothetical protein
MFREKAITSLLQRASSIESLKDARRSYLASSSHKHLSSIVSDHPQTGNQPGQAKARNPDQPNDSHIGNLHKAEGLKQAISHLS